MATLNAGDPTLLDMVKRTDPNGAIANIVELLSKKNPILQDAVAKEGNLPTGHRFTARNTLPAVGWRRYNDGIAPSKSTTEQYDETTGMLEGFAYVDCGLAKLNGNEAAFRSSEDKAFLSALNIEAVNALIYASVASNPEKLQGIMPRFNLTTGPTGAQIIDGGAYMGFTESGNDQSSIIFMNWSDETSYLIYPKGQNGGLNSEDLGKQIVDASTSGTGGTTGGRKYTAWVTHWMWNLGLCIQDQRQVVRIANIDTGQLAAATGATLASAQKGIIDAMIHAYYTLYDPNVGRTVIYTNRIVAEALHRGAMEKATYGLTIGTYAGSPVTMFQGFPIRILDGMTAAEAPVV